MRGDPISLQILELDEQSVGILYTPGGPIRLSQINPLNYCILYELAQILPVV